MGMYGGDDEGGEDYGYAAKYRFYRLEVPRPLERPCSGRRREHALGLSIPASSPTRKSNAAQP